MENKSASIKFTKRDIKNKEGAMTMIRDLNRMCFSGQVLFPDTATGTIGEWLDMDLTLIPQEAIEALETAYGILSGIV